MGINQSLETEGVPAEFALLVLVVDKPNPSSLGKDVFNLLTLYSCVSLAS